MRFIAFYCLFLIVFTCFLFFKRSQIDFKTILKRLGKEYDYI